MHGPHNVKNVKIPTSVPILGQIHALVRRFFKISFSIILSSRSQWPRRLRRGSAAACLLGLRVWIPLGAWMSVSCVVCYQLEVCASG